MLFKLTLYFKDIYTQLTETYGYPMWAVLTLFVVITIALGLLVGVVFILLLDCLCPPKKPSVEDMNDSLVNIYIPIRILSSLNKWNNLKG